MGKTVLLIEDDSSVATMLKDVLLAEGFEVLVESDGEWGLRTFQSKPVDAVILDLLVPKLQGFDVLPRLRELERGAHTPVLVISGVFRSPSYHEDLKRRFDIAGFFEKPLDLFLLKEVIRQVTGERELLPLPSLAPTRADEGRAAPLSGTLPARGEVSELSFARILGGCFEARFSGGLFLRKGAVKKIVYFREGIPTYARSNLVEDCLGRVMVAEKLISLAECEESLQRKRETPDRRQGEILMEMGSISQHNLSFALELQLQQKLFGLFSWEEGTFQLGPGLEQPGPDVALSMGPTMLIYEGAARKMSRARILADLAFAAGKAVVDAGDPTLRYQALQLEPQADLLLDRLDGRSTLEALLRVERLGEGAATLLYALLASGLLRAVAVSRPTLGPNRKATLEDKNFRVGVEVQPSPPASGLARVAARGGRRTIAAAMTVREPLAEARTKASIRSDGDRAKPNVSGAQMVPRGAPVTLPVSGSARVLGARKTGEASSVTTPQGLIERASRAATVSPSSSGAVRPLPRTPRPGGTLGSKLPAPSGGTLSKSSPPEAAGPSSAPIPDEAGATHRPAVVAPRGLSFTARGSIRLPRRDANVGSQELKAGASDKSEAPGIEAVASPHSEEFIDLARSGSAPEALVENEAYASENQLQELETRLESLEKLDLYARLKVSPGASLEAVRAAHQAESAAIEAKYGLETQGLGFSFRQRVELHHLLLDRALRTLTHPVARRAYDRSLGLRLPDEEAPPFAAWARFEEGRVAMTQGDWNSAAEAFAAAAALEPQEGLYLAHSAWACIQSQASPGEERLNELRRAAELCPSASEPLLFLGGALLRCGLRDEARDVFTRLSIRDPDSKEARRVLSEFENRAES